MRIGSSLAALTLLLGSSDQILSADWLLWVEGGCDSPRN